MKFLNLIYGGDVHLAPNQKVIPAEEFTKLVEASEVIEEIKSEGVKYRQEIAKEGDMVFEKSKEKGQDEGMAKWADQLKNLEDEIKKNKVSLEKFIAKIALATAKKVVGTELSTSPETISNIVAKSLKSVSGHKKITIFVNKDDLEKLESQRDKLKSVFEELESFSIQVRKDITPGGVIIETEAGIVDARAEVLWDKVEKAFESLIKK